MSDDRDYYIIDMRQPVGNCALFWRPHSAGYTTELSEAGLYTLEEASSHRDTDIPVHRDLVAKAMVTHVRLDRLREVGANLTVRVEEKRPRECNRHTDCDLADEKAKAKGLLGSEHCHDECCEECFGN